MVALTHWVSKVSLLAKSSSYIFSYKAIFCTPKISVGLIETSFPMVEVITKCCKLFLTILDILPNASCAFVAITMHPSYHVKNFDSSNVVFIAAWS
jgi:hypothetical protein